MADVVARLHRSSARSSTGASTTGLPERPEWLRRAIVAADLSQNAWRGLLLVAAMALPAACAIFLALGPDGALVSLACIVVGGLVPGLVIFGRRRRRVDRTIAAMPDTLDHVVRLLRTGHGPRQALVSAAHGARGPAAERLVAVVGGLDAGQEVDDATTRFAHPRDPRVLRWLSVVLAMVLHSGPGAANALDSAARSMRGEIAARAEVRALTSQSRLSVQVLALLPIGFVAVGLLAHNPRTEALLVTAAGRNYLMVGLALDALGLVWMRRIVASVTR